MFDTIVVIVENGAKVSLCMGQFEIRFDACFSYFVLWTVIDGLIWLSRQFDPNKSN